MTIKQKISDLSKDLGLQSKVLVDFFSKDGEERKSTSVLTEQEIDLALEHFTKQNAVDNMADYLDAPAKQAQEDKQAAEAKQAEEAKKAAEAKKVQEAKKEAEPKKAEPKTNTTNNAKEVKSLPNTNNNRPLQNKNTNAKPLQNKNTNAKSLPNTNNNRPLQNKNTNTKPFANKPAQNANNNNKPVQNAAPQANVEVPNDGLLRRKDGTVVETAAKKHEKANSPQVKREVVTVTVDTRTTDVNLDKFNEKYTELASNRVQENRRKSSQTNNKTKFGNKNKFGNRGNNFGKKKVETEAERLQRIQLEKARKAQLRVSIPDEIVVSELASRLKVNVAQVIKKLMGMGVMETMTSVIDFDTASLIAEEFDAKVEHEVHVTIEERLFETDVDAPETLQERPPVVVVMGHVDHGKTSILDAIRNTRVTDGEAGGITQHIGAYQVKVNDKPITFLDTPGHEAFTSMRARGANLTDIAVLVVAADDGIMPQTIESINHAKSAGVSIIVAINKMDKPTANPDRIMEQLTQYELVPEAWGGDVICVPVSAHTGMGIDTLLEMIALTSEVQELNANPDRRASGAVIEARLDKGLGPVATLLVQRGTLRQGDVLIAGTAVGRVRVMRNDQGKSLKEAGPSMPVEITGLTDVPSAGDLFAAVEDEKLARELADRRVAEMKEKQFNAYQKVTLDNLFSQIAQGEMKELPIIVKADVQGSAEAVKQSLEKITNEEVRVRVIHTGVGAINKSDVMLASAGNAIIIGFNVRPDNIAQAEAEQAAVELRMYRVIYDAINDVTDAMKGMLAPKFREVMLGKAEVRQVMKLSSVGTIAGSYILEGKVTRNAKIRLVRDGIVLTEDEISSLRRFKEDVKEVARSYECGIGLEKYTDIKEGDILEAFLIEEYRD